MRNLTKLIASLFLLVATLSPCIASADESINIPILCYHNFSPTTKGSMNLTPEKFETQIKWLKDNGFTIIPLQDAVAYLLGTRSSLPPKSIVITVDDGWRSAYHYLPPIVRKYNIPLTLFIYPETISTGKNAMTWDQLAELEQMGLFNVQGHTMSHPNFKQSKKHMSAANYDKLVKNELAHSKKILEDKLHHPITLLAWPFGIYNDELLQAAKEAGYTMAFSIDARTANRSFRPMAQPRFMIVDGQSMKTFMGIANGAKAKLHSQ